MRKGFVYLILEGASPRPALDITYSSSHIEKQKRGRFGVTATCSARTKWALGITAFCGDGSRTDLQKAKEVRLEALLAKLLMRLSGSRLSIWEMGVQILPFFHQQQQRKKWCNYAIHLTHKRRTLLASHSSDPWLGSPEIRRVPVERILSEAVYAPIKNKENRLYPTTAGKILQQS